MFKKLFSFSDEKKTAHRLYIILVMQARQSLFYENCSVADTLAGRFDMIVLHSVLLLRRLNIEPEKTKLISQALFDYMFDDFDLNLREIGIGDTGIGKRIKKMATGFYGRQAVYNEGLDSQNDDLLTEALARNLYRDMESTTEDLKQMAAYMRRESLRLEKTNLDDVLRGEFEFGAPPVDSKIVADGIPAK